MALSLTFVPTRNEKCSVCGHLINLDRVRMDCKKGFECPYAGKAADRLAEAVIEWNKKHPLED